VRSRSLSSEAYSGYASKSKSAQSSKTFCKATAPIHNNGDISIDKEAVPLGDLAEVVRNEVGDRKSALVTVQADETIDYGRVIAVMDQLRQVEGASLGMATQQPAGEAEKNN